jgi:excisionase family DNA binding protein
MDLAAPGSEQLIKKLNSQLFLSPTEAAELLRSDPRTVRLAAAAGEIPGFKVGTFWKIPTSWLRAQAQIGDGDAAAAG